MNRRTRLELAGKRALLLTGKKAERAWRMLAERLYEQGDPDRVGRITFNDLLKMVRRSTIDGHQRPKIPQKAGLPALAPRR